MQSWEKSRMRIKFSHFSQTVKNLRLFLIIFNGFCMLLSIAVIITGVVLVSERLQYVWPVFGSQLMEGSCYLSISSACVMFLLTFFGFYGALFYRRAPLLFYAVVLSICFILSLLAACIALVFQEQVYSVVKVYMKESLLTTYGTNMQNPWNNWVTRSWDEIQQSLECCGIDNKRWIIYRQTFWYKDLPGLQCFDKPYVPFSCCKKNKNGDFLDLDLCQFHCFGPPKRPPRNHLEKNRALHTTGCYKAGKDILLGIGKYFIAIGFIVAIVVCVAITASFLLYNSI